MSWFFAIFDNVESQNLEYELCKGQRFHENVAIPKPGTFGEMKILSILKLRLKSINQVSCVNSILTIDNP